ncbi:uncharacterized protein MYCFIDRAFT_178494 [Pseudocercospora fijiensis CIRAD86]|uniref:Uncharacterized protein n=1 Tax=Pseudocercospora fijiensis (strain CIRAD86) TaxID=383855 RepID=M3ALM5_PSEFD|nr:uncharacterized protein MYCFIDRAFT_178494 [Pseudocercospora fijiensis CIRAD86]EME78347.1 hypothetical protein MYCFIDRAFT_178494 [Pseudocercospora fijiensis CIRAD86]
MSGSSDSEGDLANVFIRRNKRNTDKELHRIQIDKPHQSSRKKSRRRSSRRYVEAPPKKDHDHVTDQESDDLLDDYYGGTFLGPDIRLDHDARPERISARPEPLYIRPSSMPQPLRPSAGFGAPPRPPPNGPPPPPPPISPSWSDASSYHPSHMPTNPAYKPFVPRYIPYRRNSIMVPIRRQGFIREAPPHSKGLWARAAVPIYSKGNGTLKLTLKLVLTRHGERYKSRGFIYEKGTWDDFAFATRLTQEYRRLKTDHIGLVQKLTAYKAISFVYFLQYHAFPDQAYKHGRWQISEKKAITNRDDDRGRAFFMFQLRKKARSVSKLFHVFREEKNSEARRQKHSRVWVDNLDELIEPGAVVDLEIKETFDSAKVYAALLLVILISLGAALGYGFGMEKDFSTGFSIAGWLITAFGFFAAIVAAGEYFGLESPSMTLWDAEPLDKGNVLPAGMLYIWKEFFRNLPLCTQQLSRKMYLSLKYGRSGTPWGLAENRTLHSVFEGWAWIDVCCRTIDKIHRLSCVYVGKAPKQSLTGSK